MSDDLDAAIDRVAGAMTDGAPDAAFTARVMARVESPSPHASPLVWRAAFASAIAIALALAIWQPWRGSRMEKPATTAAHETPRTDAPLAGNHTAEPQPMGDKTRSADRSGGTTARSAQIVRPSPSIGGEVPTSIDVTPISVDPMPIAAVDTPDSIQPNALAPVAPIAVTPLAGDDPERRFR